MGFGVVMPGEDLSREEGSNDPRAATGSAWVENVPRPCKPTASLTPALRPSGCWATVAGRPAIPEPG